MVPDGASGASGDQPSLPISQILSNSPEESVVRSPAASLRESDTPSRTSGLPDALSGSPPVDPSQLTSPAVAFSGIPDCPASRDLRGSLGPVLRWRLAREGPFLSERSPSSPNCFGDGCPFRHTTYRPLDYTRPSGKFGAPLHHPRFLEWVGEPESASLLEMGPGMWLHSLSREQTMDAALQLQRDVCFRRTYARHTCSPYE